ncbi:MAG TPA: hypothetical protein VMF09_00120 [Solirubrobacteraceae bacterium]|nr:hypothetical protein [Solirubrobacteraceae bacterium]
MLRDYDSKVAFGGFPLPSGAHEGSSIVIPSAEGTAVTSGLTPEGWAEETDALFGEDAPSVAADDDER